MRLTNTALFFVFAILTVPCRAAEDYHLIKHERPMKCLQGKITDSTGARMENVSVTIFDHPEVWSNPSLSFLQKRMGQHKIAAAVSDARGRFSLKKLPKGAYEVQYEKPGFDPLSVIIRVDSSTPCRKVGVRLCPSGACFDKPVFQEFK